jgi:lipopolysaccharide export LptBFGC system permease protein LptF
MGTRTKNTSRLPQELKAYFWDMEFDELTIEKNSRIISERILNYGNINAVRWLFSWADKEYISSIIKKSRNINAKSRNYWELILTPD